MEAALICTLFLLPFHHESERRGDRRSQLEQSVIGDRRSQLEQSLIGDRRSQLEQSLIGDRRSQLEQSVIENRRKPNRERQNYYSVNKKEEPIWLEDDNVIFLPDQSFFKK